jgi:hypothetical protein
MTSVMIALLLTTLCALAVPGETAVTTGEANYFDIFNGYFDNMVEYQREDSIGYIQLWARPVTSPAIPGRTILYAEWSFNGVVLNHFLANVTEESDKEVVVTLYNLEDRTSYKPGEYDVSKVATLTPSDIRQPSQCEARFRPSGKGHIMGTWPACKELFKGDASLYFGIVTCKEISLVIPKFYGTDSSPTTYNLAKYGVRYPVIDAPDNYSSPCE